MRSVDDYYCVKVVRYGAAGIEEARFDDHALSLHQASIVIESHLNTLGPGDKAEVTLTRGVQAQ